VVDRTRDITKRLRAVELLRSLRETGYQNQEIARMLNLSPAEVSRYVHGHCLPSPQRAEQIIRLFARKKRLIRDVKRLILGPPEQLPIPSLDEEGLHTLSDLDVSILLHKPNTLKRIALYAVEAAGGKRITKVVASSGLSTPLAAIVAAEERWGLVLISESKYSVSAPYLVMDYTLGPGHVCSLYLRRGLVDRRDSLFLVEITLPPKPKLRAILDLLTKRCEASVASVFAVVSSQSSLTLLDKYGIPYEVLLTSR